VTGLGHAIGDGTIGQQSSDQDSFALQKRHGEPSRVPEPYLSVVAKLAPSCNATFGLFCLASCSWATP
jgi:hypothetical protein